MAWNEPGRNGREDKDPWRRNAGEGPPDLDAAFRAFLKKFRKGGSGDGSAAVPPFSVGVILLIVAILYGIAGVFIVGPAEEAVLTRFGKFVRTEGAGPHWHPRFIEAVNILNVKEVLENQHAGLMLTRDENIVSVEIAVQYQKENPRDYLFNLYQPEETLKHVTEAALRYVIGHSTLDEVLTSGRAEISAKIKDQITKNLSDYVAGIVITDVVMQPARAPDEVKQAFDDAIRAQEDEIRLMNQAEAYAMRVQPIAEGGAARKIEEAGAYKQQVVSLAKGEVQRFSALLKEYQKAPEVTKKRLYFDTMQKVLSATTKVIVDTKGSQPFVYLPLDKIISEKRAKEENNEKNRENSGEPQPTEEKGERTSESRGTKGERSSRQWSEGS